jgi:hypothetical protein
MTNKSIETIWDRIFDACKNQDEQSMRFLIVELLENFLDGKIGKAGVEASLLPYLDPKLYSIEKFNPSDKQLKKICNDLTYFENRSDKEAIALANKYLQLLKKS